MNNSINVGGSVVRDGLVALYDVANVRSYEGEPTENLCTNQDYITGSGTGSVYTHEKMTDGPYKGWNKITAHRTRDSGVLVARTQHIHFDVGEVGTFSLEYVSTNPQFQVHLNGQQGHGLANIPLGNNRYYRSFTQNFAGQQGLYFRWMGGTIDIPEGVSIYYRNIQYEKKPHPTPFTPTSRSPVNALKDLSGNNYHFDFDGDGPNESVLNGNMVNFGFEDFAILSGADTPKINFTKIDSFSLSAWFRVNEVDSIGSNTGIISKDITSNSFGISRVGNSLLVGIRDSSGSTLTTNVPYALGEICYITMNYSPHTMEVYKNGEHIYTSSIAPIDWIDGDIGGSSPWRISHNGISGTYRKSDTDIGQIAIYNRMLSDDEVKHNFNSHKSRFGL